MAYGAYYGIHEALGFQTEIIKAKTDESAAQIAKTRAEADAREATTSASYAVDKARYEIGKDYAAQLERSNQASTDVSKRIQELVSNELNDMEKVNQLNRVIDEKTKVLADQDRARQAASLTEAAAKLQDLQTQIKIAETQKQQYLRQASLATYNDMVKRIVDQTQTDYVNLGFVDALRDALSDPVVLAQAQKETADSSKPWAARAVLDWVLFQNTLDAHYAEALTAILRANRASVGKGMANLLNWRGFSNPQDYVRSAPLVVGLAADETFNPVFRDELIRSLAFFYRADSVPADEALKVARYAGSRVVTLTAQPHKSCFDIENLFTLVHSWDSAEQATYTDAALRNLGTDTDTDSTCIRNFLSMNPPPR